MVIDPGGIGPDPECLIPVDQHAVDRIVAESAFAGYIDAGWRYGQILFIQDT